MADATLVHDDAALAAALERLRGAQRLALDTEFMRESTYHAQLCLVQVASDEASFLFDPLAGIDLAGLHALLQERQRPKIVHAARQDLEVLNAAGGAVPGPVFDTQVAAALLGLPPQVGYAELVARKLGHSIDKGQTRTDWSRRPLSPEQLAYAADDVHHLLELHTLLTAELRAQGRLDWLAEDCAAFEDPALYRADPADSARRLKGLNRLPPRAQAIARALAEWREQRAIADDRPRGWILSDEALYGIATLAPATLEDLATVRALPPGVVKRRGSELLERIATATGTAAAAVAPPAWSKPPAEEVARAARLMQAVRGRAEALGISAEVLATRRDVDALAADPQAEGRLQRGWRGTVLGEALRAAAAG
jgi:ribonuclease D